MVFKRDGTVHRHISKITNDRKQMKCSNCSKDKADVFLVLSNEQFYSCEGCMVTYAKDRSGFAWMLNQEVKLKDMFSSKTNGRVFILKGIYIHEDCESGRLVFLVDKETGRPLKYMLDCNWLKSI